MPGLSSEQKRLARELLAQGQKIAAIKLYREVTGANLKDAKEAVEAMEMSKSGHLPSSAQVNDLDPHLEIRIKRLLAERKKIEAVKIYREVYNCGLKEAKEAVDRIQAGMRREKRSSMPPISATNIDPFAEDARQKRSCLVIVITFLIVLLGGIVFLYLTGNGF